MKIIAQLLCLIYFIIIQLTNCNGVQYRNVSSSSNGNSRYNVTTLPPRTTTESVINPKPTTRRPRSITTTTPAPELEPEIPPPLLLRNSTYMLINPEYFYKHMPIGGGFGGFNKPTLVPSYHKIYHENVDRHIFAGVALWELSRNRDFYRIYAFDFDTEKVWEVPNDVKIPENPPKRRIYVVTPYNTTCKGGILDFEDPPEYDAAIVLNCEAEYIEFNATVILPSNRTTELFCRNYGEVPLEKENNIKCRGFVEVNVQHTRKFYGNNLSTLDLPMCKVTTLARDENLVPCSQPNYDIAKILDHGNRNTVNMDGEIVYEYDISAGVILSELSRNRNKYKAYHINQQQATRSIAKLITNVTNIDEDNLTFILAPANASCLIQDGVTTTVKSYDPQIGSHIVNYMRQMDIECTSTPFYALIVLPSNATKTVFCLTKKDNPSKCSASVRMSDEAESLSNLTNKPFYGISFCRIETKDKKSPPSLRYVADVFAQKNSSIPCMLLRGEQQKLQAQSSIATLQNLDQKTVKALAESAYLGDIYKIFSL